MSRRGVYKTNQKHSRVQIRGCQKINDKGHFRADVASCLGMLAGFNLSEIGLAEQVENPCVGGSIPPRATKKHQNHLWVVFSFDPL